MLALRKTTLHFIVRPIMGSETPYLLESAERGTHSVPHTENFRSLGSTTLIYHRGWSQRRWYLRRACTATLEHVDALHLHIKKIRLQQ